MMRGGRMYRTLWRSVVSVGSLQLSVTRLPLRLARRSAGGLGSSRDGGSGGPVWAQPANSRQSAVKATNFPRFTFMRKEKEYQRDQIVRARLSSREEQKRQPQGEQGIGFAVFPGGPCAQEPLQEFFQGIIRGLPEIAYILDEAGRFKQWTSTFQKALGYTAQEIARIDRKSTR